MASAPPVAGAVGTLSTYFTLSPNGGLAANGATITLTGSAGTAFPSSASDYTFFDGTTDLSQPASGTATLTNGGGTTTVSVPLSAQAGDSLILSVSDVTNPASPGGAAFSVSTSSDTVPGMATLEITDGAIASGTVTNNSSNAINGALLEACPTTGGTCVSSSANASGDFSMLLGDGSYALTARAGGYTQSTVTVTISGTTPTSANLTLQPATGLPSGTSITTPSGTIDSGSFPRVYTGAPMTITTTGCPGGIGFEVITAPNSQTGQDETEYYPLTENPPMSGDFSASIPPLAPIHGTGVMGSAIDCIPNTALDPDGGPTGGGTPVLISGSGFSGVTAVDFGATPATSFKVIDDSTIEADSPPGTGTVQISVTASSGSITSGELTSYTYDSVTGLSPASGPGGTPVTITGTGLGATASVWFGASPAESFSVVSNTEVLAIAPPGAGTVDVLVTGALHTTALSAADQFTYAANSEDRSVDTSAQKARVVAAQSPSRATSSHGVSPNVRPAGEGFELPGGPGVPSPMNPGAWNGLIEGSPGALAYAGVINAAINCINAINAGGNCSTPLWVDPSGSVVDQNGNPVQGATVTVLRSNTPAGPFTAVPAGNAEIDPTTNPETSDSNGQFAWDVLAGYYQIEASKTGCTAPGDPSDATATTAVLSVPPPQVGLKIVLDCAGSTRVRPAVSGLSAAFGPAAGGTSVTISGSGLEGTKTIKFGSAKAKTFSVLSPTAIDVTAPAHTAAKVSVIIKTSGGKSASTTADQFTYLPLPKVASVTPNSGPAAGGTHVTISGPFSNVSQVLFGNKSAPYLVLSNGDISALSPAGKGSQKVNVTTACLAGEPITSTCGTSSSGVAFSYHKT